jgi:hypothetical protein
MTPDEYLDEWILAIRNKDPLTFEDAYLCPRPVGPLVVPRLIAELRSAVDAYTRGQVL